MSESSNVYDQTNIDTMEMVWGKGYMSAGGDVEVAQIVSGLDLRNMQILDLGCGLGGASVAMARDLGAKHVLGVDIDAGVLQRAARLVEEAGVGDCVTLQQIEPGPLPFDGNRFDLVYLNAVSCHFKDLRGFFAGIHRVLRSDGSLRGSDWFKLGDNEAFRDYDDLLRQRGLNFFFVTRDEFESALRDSGFQSIRFVDRTEAVGQIASDGLRHVEKDLKDELVTRLGQNGYSIFHHWAVARMNSLIHGGMGHGHFHARSSSTD